MWVQGIPFRGFISISSKHGRTIVRVYGETERDTFSSHCSNENDQGDAIELSSFTYVWLVMVMGQRSQLWRTLGNARSKIRRPWESYLVKLFQLPTT